MHWATLHGINCIQSSWMESTAFNRDAFYHAAWNPLHSMTLHGIHCINRDAFYHAAWNPLHSLGIHLAMLHGMHYLQSGCFGPCCIKSTAFNRDALGHAPWNQLHSIKLDGIHCIQLGSIAQRCMESTAFNQNPLHHTAWNPLHSLEIHWATLHGIYCIQSCC